MPPQIRIDKKCAVLATQTSSIIISNKKKSTTEVVFLVNLMSILKQYKMLDSKLSSKYIRKSNMMPNNSLPS